MGQKHVGMCVVNGKALKPDKMQTGEPKWLHDAGVAVGVVIRTLRSKKPDEPPKKQDKPPKKKAKMSTEKDEPPKKDEDIFGSNPTIPHLQEIPEITGDEQAANRAAGGTVLSSDGPSSQDGAVEEEEEEETVANLMDAGQELLMSRQVCCFNDVDLVLSSHATAGRSLVRNCPSRSALPGKRAEARETCLLRYEEHHTDQASVADPTQYAFCWGLKFKMPSHL